MNRKRWHWNMCCWKNGISIQKVVTQKVQYSEITLKFTDLIYSIEFQSLLLNFNFITFNHSPSTTLSLSLSSQNSMWAWFHGGRGLPWGAQSSAESMLLLSLSLDGGPGIHVSLPDIAEVNQSNQWRSLLSAVCWTIGRRACAAAGETLIYVVIDSSVALAIKTKKANEAMRWSSW